MADISECLEASAGYGNLLKFDSGKYGISFDSTGGVDERIWGKDPAVGVSASILYVDFLQLTGEATGGPLAFVDGSVGQAIVSLANSDASYGGGIAGSWDFRGDPLRCLTAESTQSVCISSTVNGRLSGFIKCHWG